MSNQQWDWEELDRMATAYRQAMADQWFYSQVYLMCCLLNVRDWLLAPFKWIRKWLPH
jgi:hypothetical protein